ncbi:MAG TPA: hypothetical protein VK737_06335, partial [Opitutales bacterium]|nr:hypothetical protein [Opitutales bacterium]
RVTGGADPVTGKFARAVVVAGLDPGAFIRVEEQSQNKEPDKVTDWKFMFAGQVRARLVPNADTAALAKAIMPLGWNFTGVQDKDGWVTIVLKDHDVKSVPQAVAQLKAWPQWVADATPDYLPAPSLTAK